MDVEVLEGILYLIHLFWPVLLPVAVIALLIPIVIIKWIVIWKIAKKTIETQPYKK